MADNQIRLPSGQGGLVRYFEESKSRIELSPTTVIIICVAIIALVILLHSVGGSWF